MTLLQMIESSGNTVTRRVSSAVFRWMLAISTTVDNISGGGSVFDTLSAPSANSLNSLTASQIGSLITGESIVFVKSVKDFFRWDGLSTLTADGITIFNPVNNPNATGRFIRELIPAPEWMLQATWFIDGSNVSGTANDENNGLTAATALLTDLERNRRMGGPTAQWILAEYHLRYVSDIDYVNLEGDLVGSTVNGCNVFAHGSATNGQGKTTLYTGVIDALVAQNEATNTPYQVTSNALPVSWTASALIQAQTNPNCRIRITSNTVGAKAFAVFDQGAKQARWTNNYNASVYTAPYSTGTTSTAIVNGSTFVVEALTQIKSFHCGFIGKGNLLPGSSIANGIFVAESLMLGQRGANLGACVPIGGCSCIYDGCILIVPVSGSYNRSFTATGSWLGTTAVGGSLGIPLSGTLQFTAGGTDASLTWNGVEAINPAVGYNNFRNNFMFQNARLLVAQGACAISSIAVFDPPAATQMGIQVTGTGVLNLIPSGGGLTPGKLWGGGSVRPPTTAIFINNPGRAIYADSSTLTLLGTTVDITFDTRGTQVPAFDQATSLFTAPRTTSYANLNSTVAAGGFGGSILDPVSGAYFGRN